MPKYKLLVIIQKDPLGEGIGGMHTFIRGLVKHLPSDFEIELVGVTTDRIKRPVGKWKVIEFSNRTIKFFPVLYREDQNKNSRIPLSLLFSLSLIKYRSRIPLKNRILEFHRIEPAFLFRRLKNPKVVFIHGNVEELYNPFSEIKWHKFPWLYFQLEKMIITGFTKIFVVSQKGLDFYRKRYKDYRDRFSFLPTWVDLDIFYPLRSEKEKEYEISKLSISSQDKILLFAGRLVGSKNPLLLIDSFKKIYDEDKKVTLLIVGDGGLKSEVIKRINEYGLQKKTKLLGIFSQDRLSRLMRACDLFILTSACEGMPRIVNEALASGIPVVSTNVGEVWRVVKDGHSGTLVSGHHASEIAGAAINILRNKKIYSPDNCLDTVKEYSVENVLNDIYKIFRDIAVPGA